MNDAPAASAGTETGRRQSGGSTWAPDVVVVGAASRDLTSDDPRGWRLGGAVAYASLAIGRLGLRVAAIIGADALAAEAHELEVMRQSGVELHLIRLRRGPVFENVETRRGRVQRALEVADPLDSGVVDVLAGRGTMARGWFLAPVAGELSERWVQELPPRTQVALGWQGLLRTFAADGTVGRRVPATSALVRRADIVGVSRDDVAPETSIDDLAGLLGPEATLILTHGMDGGIVVGPDRGGRRQKRRYPAIESARPVDLTGAGDTFLAALFAARLEPRLIGGRIERGFDLLLGAAAASLVVEAPGLEGIPTRPAIRERMRNGLAQRRRYR